jgi:SulP family sulfate permease
MTQASEGKGGKTGFRLADFPGHPADRPGGLGRDIIAGFTLAALSIPGTMGYTKIIGTPVITGLYTILIPMCLFAIFGSSRHLSVNADSATAAVVAAGLAGMAVRGSNEWLALCSLLALMAAAFMFARARDAPGLSSPIFSRARCSPAFSPASACRCRCSRSPACWVCTAPATTRCRRSCTTRSIGQTNPYASAVSLAVLVVIIGGKKISEKIPGGLIAVLAPSPPVGR